MKKLLFLLILLLALPMAALAGPTVLSVYVTPAEVENAGTVQSSSLWKCSSGVYMFLPSHWDASQLRIWSTDGAAITVNGQSYASGDLLPALEVGKTIKVRHGSGSTEVQVRQSANVPTVFMTTESGSLSLIESSKANKEPGTILIVDADGDVVCDQALTSVKCRGNTSYRKSPKKSYQFKLTDKQNLFGHGKSKTWLLITGYRDRSFLRNVIASDLANYVGLPYTPGYTFCDLYVNGEYRGFYLLAEKVQIGKNRLAIDDLEEATQALNDQPLSSYKKQGA